MRGYRGSQENTKEVTEGYSWLKGVTTGGYRVSGNNKVVFIYFGIIHFNFPFYNLQNVSFLIFLFYWKQLLKIDKILISQLWYTRW